MNGEIGRIDHQAISSWIEKGASVLDLGCGDGILLAILAKEKQIRAQGIELSDQSVHSCVAAGLNVFQQDIDSGLAEYADKSFDFVILNQTFQQVKKPNYVLAEALRVGKKVIVGFPNFCYITDRFQLFFKGKDANDVPGFRRSSRLNQSGCEDHFGAKSSSSAVGRTIPE